MGARIILDALEKSHYPCRDSNPVRPARGPNDVMITTVRMSMKDSSTDMRRLTTGISSDKCVGRRFRRFANIIERTYTNLDSAV